MPILSAMIAQLFGGLVAFFGRFMLHKAALVAATITANGLLVVGLMAAQLALITSIQVSLPQNQYFLTGLWLAIPDNGPFVVSACLSVDALIALYRWNQSNVRLAATAGS